LGSCSALAITRLLNGIAGFVQHPAEHRVYPIHLGWVLTLLLTLVHFRWWKFWLIETRQWTFAIYFFVITYAILLFLLCSILFPDSLKYAGYEDYFICRRKWFFGIFRRPSSSTFWTRCSAFTPRSFWAA
jgi:hypothetical protein